MHIASKPTFVAVELILSHIKCILRCQDSSMVRFLRIDPVVNGSSPTAAATSTYSEESRQLSVIPGVGITSCGHIQRQDWTLLDKQRASQCPNFYL